METDEGGRQEEDDKVRFKNGAGCVKMGRSKRDGRRKHLIYSLPECEMQNRFLCMRTVKYYVKQNKKERWLRSASFL